MSSAMSAEQRCTAQPKGYLWVPPTVTAAREKAAAAALLLESGLKFPLCRQRTPTRSSKMAGLCQSGVKMQRGLAVERGAQQHLCL